MIERGREEGEKGKRRESEEQGEGGREEGRVMETGRKRSEG